MKLTFYQFGGIIYTKFLSIQMRGGTDKESRL